IRPDVLSGIEIKNGHPRHDSRNDVAFLWAKKYDLHGIGGSDFHQKQDLGSSGILTDQKVGSLDELLHVLRGDLYTVF
ncbi:MAG: transposase, partial [Lentisphaeria bacterium]|nr:transposase [Lentisphaeria bacterium]